MEKGYKLFDVQQLGHNLNQFAEMYEAFEFGGPANVDAIVAVGNGRLRWLGSRATDATPSENALLPKSLWESGDFLMAEGDKASLPDIESVDLNPEIGQACGETDTASPKFVGQSGNLGFSFTPAHDVQMP